MRVLSHVVLKQGVGVVAPLAQVFFGHILLNLNLTRRILKPTEIEELSRTKGDVVKKGRSAHREITDRTTQCTKAINIPTNRKNNNKIQSGTTAVSQWSPDLVP